MESTPLLPRAAWRLLALAALPLTVLAQPVPPQEPADFLDRVEGNWEVTATNTPDPGKTDVSYVSLRKTRQLQLNGQPFSPGGSFPITPPPNWRWVRVGGTDWYNNRPNSVTYSPDGSLTITGYWGRISNFRPVGAGEMRGTWKYGEQSGVETWRRIVPRINSIEYVGHPTTDKVNVGERPGRFQVDEFSDGMRGNKRGFTIRFFGENLWGYHYAWVEGTGLEFYTGNYITDPTSGKRDNVIGFEISGCVWSPARPGMKQVHFDDLTFPFELIMEGLPHDIVSFEWRVIDPATGERAAPQASIVSRIRLRAQTERAGGADTVDATVHLTRVDGTKEDRTFRLTRSQPGKVFDSAVQRLVPGVASERDMIHVMAGDRFEAEKDTHKATLAVVPIRSEFRGSRLQQMCELLSARLVRFYELQARQQTIATELARLIASADKRPRDLPDAGPLRSAIASWQEKTADYNSASDRARLTQATLDSAESALTRAETALSLARTNLRLEPRLLLPVVAGDTHGRPANDLLRDRRVAIENLRANNASADLIRQKEAALRELEQAIVSALSDKQRARDQALAARDAARVAHRDAPAPDANAALTAWTAVRNAADSARDRLPESSRRSMPALPVSRTDANAERLANQALQGLTASLDTLDASRTALRRSLTDRLAESDRIDTELLTLGRDITTIRASAGIEAENALHSLGAEDESEVWEAFTRLKAGVSDAKDLFEPGEGRFDKLEKVREHFSGTKEGAELVDAAKETIGTGVEVLTFLGEQGERIEKLHELQRELQSPRTALHALSLMLTHTSDAISAVPVVGPTVGRALSLYAQSAAAAGVAVIRIQDHMIQPSLTLFVGVPPERHLYILDEIPASVPDAEQQRVLTMLQVRRLMALVQAHSLDEARNQPYRVR